LFVGGIFAQTHNGSAIPGAIANYAASDVQGTTYIMEGTTVPMWVRPDAYFHPNYNPGTSNWTLTDGFTWNFTGTATTSLTVTQANAQDNYVTVAAPAASAGAYVLSVTENAPAAYGGCAGPQVNLNINVVARPNITIAAGATYAFCEGNGGFPADIQSTITGGWRNYHLVWNLEIATLDNGGAKQFYYDDENGTNPAGVQKYAVNYTPLAPQIAANAAAAPNLMTVTAFNAINNGTRDAVTVYTYNLVSINDQASRFGDFITLAGVAAPTNDQFTYLAAADQVIVTVYPAPVTGPIYHISDNWQQ
jgi:hypothetical protein